ncbi:Rgp1-domain-containing protein [Myriangium duriaei CBS 260.36]|uniref:Rgp1-domain-containing protein n=1 Tax=Myriangium duriaei CBS 260.36 TaxID=1168546 RepID=A0A9P4MIG9_9PEZI|nr:Rgp1-domain-containing protein [Myriangium duriaei CBS 260.36]
MPSNLRTYVQWKDSSVFAGEDIECVITFKNVARTPQQKERDAAQAKQRSRFDPLQPILERQRNPTSSTAFTKPSIARLPSVASVSTAANRPGHRQTLSLGVEPSTPPTDHALASRRPKAHGRSLSILSIGAEGGAPAGARNKMTSPGSQRGRHGRSASLQILSRGSSYGSPSIAAVSNPNSPYFEQGANGSSSFPRADRRKSGPRTAPTTPALPQERPRFGLMSPGFTFPIQDPVREESKTGSADFTPPIGQNDTIRSKKQSQILSPVSPGDTTGLGITSLSPMAQVLPDSSVNGTSRASSEIYTMSNVSEETIDSELPPQSSTNLMLRPSLSRQASQRRPRKADLSENLMMGYIQTMGQFSVDGSLVNQAPFEEVKRKGVVSSQAGGGVVGVETSKRQSGLLGAFGWGNIGESLTGLLGMDEMSSMREMKNVASMKNVPLLSTPQSILFVDLRLGPGESRSYTYRFKIPKGLPPTHKGRAIKVTYNLRIAVQRPGSAESKNIKNVEIPFRVLGSVNRDGEVLGHDLMSPYILLQDTARTTTLPTFKDPAQYFSVEQQNNYSLSAGSMDDFLRYTERLMEQQPTGAPLISPTAMTHNRRFSQDVPQPQTMKERIDLAIFRSNQTLSSEDVPAHSTNRFTIARAGHHVGVLTILRPSYRLGETVHVKIDFTPPLPQQQQYTYLVTVSLETIEKIDPTLALRSPASVVRATRKVHAAAAQTVLFARQAAVALEIPAAATPSFETSGVQLAWRLRVEFTTSLLQEGGTAGEEEQEEGFDEDEEEEHGGDEKQQLTAGGRSAAGQLGEYPLQSALLEPLSADDRGLILVARERLAAESWEVSVPVKVFGVHGGAVGDSGLGGLAGGGGGVSEVLEI